MVDSHFLHLNCEIVAVNVCLLRTDRNTHTHTRFSIWEVHRHIIHHETVICANEFDFVCKSMLVQINHLDASPVHRMRCIYTWRNHVFISNAFTPVQCCRVASTQALPLPLSSLFALNLPLYWCYSRGQCVRKNTHINLANAIAMERVSDFVPGEYFSHHIISVKFEFDRWLEKRESILYSETTTSYVSANSILPTRLPVPTL